MDQRGPPGNSTITCVNTMKARPVPSEACNEGFVISCWDVVVTRLKMWSDAKTRLEPYLNKQQNTVSYFCQIYLAQNLQAWFVLQMIKVRMIKTRSDSVWLGLGLFFKSSFFYFWSLFYLFILIIYSTGFLEPSRTEALELRYFNTTGHNTKKFHAYLLTRLL